MGKIGRWIGSGLLGLSLATGIVSVTKMNQLDNQLKRDPDYITSTEVWKVSNKVSDAANYLQTIRENTDSHYTTFVGGAPVTGTIHGPEKVRHPDMEKAREELKEARNGLHKIETKADPKGDIQREILTIERNLPKDYDAKNSDLRSKYDEISQINKQLELVYRNYQDKAFEKQAPEDLGSRLGLLAAGLVGGTIGLTRLVEDKKQKKPNVKAAYIGVAGILLALFSLSMKFTGNVVAEIPSGATQGIGIFFLIIGALGMLTFIVDKRQIKVLRKYKAKK